MGRWVYNFRRWMRHIFMLPWQVHRYFPSSALLAIEQAIEQTELGHQGEVCFVVEPSLHPGDLLKGKTPRQRAIELFGQLHVWDTEYNSGVLIYLLLADRDVEIVADRGIHRLVGDAFWESVCHEMEIAFRQGQFQSGVMTGIDQIGKALREHIPSKQGQLNEVSNRPLVL